MKWRMAIFFIKGTPPKPALRKLLKASHRKERLSSGMKDELLMRMHAITVSVELL